MHQLADNDADAPRFIPLIWQGDGSNQSPNYSGRGSMYGVGGIPHSQWQGYMNDIGGGTTYPRYLNHYNQIESMNAPMEITSGMNITRDNLTLTADISMTDDISTTNNKVIFILSYDFTDIQDPDYFASVIEYEDQVFELTSNGETGTYSTSFPFDDGWNLARLTAVFMVQTFSENHFIHQAASTTFTGLLPMFSTNVNSGPANLWVQFSNNSFPQNGIDLFEWDLDGDGVFETYDENPFYLYDTPGTYDISLRITVEGETAESTLEDYITVTDGSDISGNLSGAWLAENSPYTITGNAEIAVGDFLSIEPGTEITVNNSSIIIYGLLSADSQDSEPIIFSSESSWFGLFFDETEEDNVLNNCLISGSSASAIAIDDAKLDIVNCRIFNNTGTNTGAAIDISNANDVLIHNNVITNNSNVGTAGVIRFTNSIPTITNNIIVNNSGTIGGVICLKSSSNATFLNNTIANNYCESGMIFVFNSAPVFKNSIIINNGEMFTLIPGDLNPVISYTCITGGYEGLGNIDADPMFVNPTDGDGPDYDGLSGLWHLLEGSPCIDAGDPSSTYNDVEDPENPGYALYPAMGTLTNDMGAFGGQGFVDFVGIEDDEQINELIVQNRIIVYPNPFKPFTNISLQLTSEDKKLPVNLGVYNVKGQLVKTILDNEIVNEQIYNWNGYDNSGKRSASGIYFIKLETSSTTNLQKIMSIR